MGLPVNNIGEFKNVAYVRLNKAHWQLSSLGAGLFGALTIFVAFNLNPEDGVVGFMVFLIVVLFITFPFNSYITF